MNFFRRRPSFESVLKQPFESPERLCAFVARHVRYKADPKERDHWQMPEETWKRGLGDCEDLASLVYRLAKVSGFDVSVFALFSPQVRSGHVFLSGQHLGSRWVYSNNVFRWTHGANQISWVAGQIGFHLTGLYTIPVEPERMFKEVMT